MLVAARPLGQQKSGREVERVLPSRLFCTEPQQSTPLRSKKVEGIRYLQAADEAEEKRAYMKASTSPRATSGDYILTSKQFDVRF